MLGIRNTMYTGKLGVAVDDENFADEYEFVGYHGTVGFFALNISADGIDQGKIGTTGGLMRGPGFYVSPAINLAYEFSLSAANYLNGDALYKMQREPDESDIDTIMMENKKVQYIAYAKNIYYIGNSRLERVKLQAYDKAVIMALIDEDNRSAIIQIPSPNVTIIKTSNPGIEFKYKKYIFSPCVMKVYLRNGYRHLDQSQYDYGKMCAEESQAIITVERTKTERMEEVEASTETTKIKEVEVVFRTAVIPKLKCQPLFAIMSENESSIEENIERGIYKPAPLPKITKEAIPKTQYGSLYQGNNDEITTNPPSPPNKKKEEEEDYNSSSDTDGTKFQKKN